MSALGLLLAQQHASVVLPKGVRALQGLPLSMS